MISEYWLYSNCPEVKRAFDSYNDAKRTYIIRVKLLQTEVPYVPTTEEEIMEAMAKEITKEMDKEMGKFGFYWDELVGWRYRGL